MTSPPPAPRPPEKPDGPTDGAAAPEQERFGPLELLRIHKDDGRELIFFRDAREQP